MDWDRTFRRIHRSLAAIFTVAVLIVVVAVVLQEPPTWVFYLPLPPLILLMLAGLYLLAQPHVSRWRDRRRVSSG